MNKFILVFKDENGEDCFVNPGCECIEFTGKLLYKDAKTAERTLKKIMDILPIRYKNIKDWETKTPTNKTEVGFQKVARDCKNMLENGIEIKEVSISII